MYVDIPKLTRCCCCLPLRRGILAFAYFNLVLAILSVAAVSYVIHLYGNLNTIAVYRGNYFYSNSILSLLLLLLDVVFHVVLLVGAHMKNVLPMKVYYYYGISTTVAAFLLNITLMFTSGGIFLEEIVMVFFSTAFHSYLILLVRSEILKLDASQPHQYVNRLTDIVVNNQTRQDTKSLISDS